MVAVALHAGHPGGVAQGCAEVGGGRAFASGPLADEDFGAAAVGVVVVVYVVEELLGGAVVVIVDDVGADAFDGGGGDELEVRVLLLDGFVELGVAGVVGAGPVELVLIADFDVGEVEGVRDGRPLGALGSPFGGNGAGDILDLFESFVNVRFKIRAGGYELLVRGCSIGEDGEEGLHVEVFTPEEELEQAHAVGGFDAHGLAWVGPLTVDERPNSLLPVEALPEAVAFEVVAAGKAQEGGVHGGEFLHDVDAVAVGAIVVSGREEGYEAEPDGAGVL